MPAPQRSIFRKAALEHLASPERLDQLLELSPSWALPHNVGALLRGLGQRIREPRSTHKRVKTPTVLQMEAVECGAAALAMVLGYYGRVVPLEELRVVCGVGRDGSKASNILKAAHSYGLNAKGYKKDTDALPGLPLPLIAFWNFNHFVVVEGFGPRGVYLNDPALGRRIVDAQEFDRSFTGVVLLFEPGDAFEPSGVRACVWSAVRERIAGAGPALLLAGLGSLLLLIPGLLLPFGAQILVDELLTAGRSAWLAPLLLALLGAALLRGGLSWLQGSVLLRLQCRLMRQSSSDFAQHLLRLPLAFFMQRHAGDIGARVQLNERVARLLWADIVPACFGLLLVVACGLLMFWYDAALAVIAVAAALLQIAVLRLFAQRQAAARQLTALDHGRLAGEAYAGLHAIETIKATGMDEQFWARWAGYQANVINGEQALAWRAQLANIAASLLAALSSIVILVLGSLRVLDGALTPGMLVAFGLLYAGFLAPFGRLIQLGNALQDLLANSGRLDDVLRYPVARADGPDEPELAPHARLQGTVELREISFGYSPLEPPLIDKLSLKIEPGRRVALVGGSGSGKSTVAKLLAGLYEPWSGEILLDGRARDATPRRLLTRSLALVDQDIVLYRGTVRENLTLWNKQIDDAALADALRDADLLDEIMARPGGLDALIDEGGRDLSGGQRQRLEIARALAGEPSILILDEATSALDPLTEQAIDTQLRRRGCTTLIVAHRLSTIRDADEIVVLEAGKVLQRGTHELLLAQSGPYAELIGHDTLQMMSDE